MDINRFLSALLIPLFAFSSSAYGEERTRHQIWFNQPASLDHVEVWYEEPGFPKGGAKPEIAGKRGNRDQEWERASLPIGNGSLGANVMGSIEMERVTFNEKTLWRGGPKTSSRPASYWNTNKQSAHILDEIRNAFLADDKQLAARLTSENFNGTAEYEPDAEKPFRFGNFTTAGEFHIETAINEASVSDYRRSLSLDLAEAVVSFQHNGTAYKREFFISYPANVLVMRFSADQPSLQNLHFTYSPNPVSTGGFRKDGDDGFLWNAVLDNNGMHYVVRVKALAKGGVLSNDGASLNVAGADEVVFVVSADTDYKINFDPDFADPETYTGTDPLLTTAEWISSAVEKGYDRLYQEHVEDYTSLFNRVALELNGNDGDSQMPTPDRLQAYREGAEDYGLEELYFQFGRYLLIASSRPGNMPANLQGIWHNNVDGAWRIDYHNNINVQMNYWPACSTNLSECELPFLDYIHTLVKPGTVTAQSYYGARGWTASISANIFGFTPPLSSKKMTWNLCPVAGPWLSTHIWDYYEYTRDKRYLKKEGYPILKQSADFICDFLWERPDGIFTSAPSTSPEHGPIDQGATFVHAVAREVLMDAIQASKLLGTDKQSRKEWKHVLDHLAPYEIGRYGQLMEWSEDIDDPNDHHRHVNHLFGLHPGKSISPVTTPKLAEAAKVVLEHRGDGATGWSMGWKLNQWARLHDGNRAYLLYTNLLKNGTADNLWDLHPPFQIDGNFGGTAGVVEMLLQSHMGFIHLLPSLPDAWKEGKVSGLCARGNFEISISWAEGRLAEVTVFSGSGEDCLLNYHGKELKFKTQKGKTYHIRYDGSKLEMA